MNFKKLFAGLAAFALVLGTLSPIAGVQEVFAGDESGPEVVNGTGIDIELESVEVGHESFDQVTYLTIADVPQNTGDYLEFTLEATLPEGAAITHVDAALNTGAEWRWFGVEGRSNTPPEEGDADGESGIEDGTVKDSDITLLTSTDTNDDNTTITLQIINNGGEEINEDQGPNEDKNVTLQPLPGYTNLKITITYNTSEMSEASMTTEEGGTYTVKVSETTIGSATFDFVLPESTMSLEGFSDQTMTVGQSKTFHGMITGLTWVDDGLYTMTLSSEDVADGDLEITTSGIDIDILGVALPFDVNKTNPEDDEDYNPYAPVEQDITIKANKAGTYTLVFTMNRCENVLTTVMPAKCDETVEDWSLTREFVLTVKNKSSGGGGGGYAIGGGSNSSDAPTDTDTSDDDTNTDTDSSSTPTQEQSDAYEFAYEYGITTMGSLAAARVADPVTRAEFAKMISVFAEQFTDASLDTDASCEFSDLDAVNDELAGFIEKACQYGIMGQNMGDHFRPNDIISRAEVATTISRLLGLASDGEEMYYVPHLQAMMDAGYITQNTPDIAELRGYMFIMLQRIAEIE